MKKFIAIILTIVMLAAMMCVSVLAVERDPIISPEKGNDDPPEPTPESPSTGCVLGLAGAAAIALTSGGVVVFSAKKARENH